MPAVELNQRYNLVDIIDKFEDVLTFIKDNDFVENLPFLIKSKKLINANIITRELDECLDRENLAINQGISSPEFGERLANALKPKSKI